MQNQKLPKQHTVFLSSDQLLSSGNTRLDLSFQAKCLEQTGVNSMKSVEKNFPSFVEIRDKKLIIFSEKKQEILCGFQLCVDVIYSPLFKTNISSEKQINNRQIVGIKFTFEGNTKQITIFPQSTSIGQELYAILGKKQIFESNFSESYKPFQVLKKDLNTCYYNAKQEFSPNQVRVKAYSQEILNQQIPGMKQSFQNQFHLLKNFKLPHVLKLLKVFKSTNSIYMIYEKPDYCLKDFIVHYGFPDTQTKKFIVKLVLTLLNELCKNNLFHGNIAVDSLYLVMNSDKKNYELKIGNFENCGFIQHNSQHQIRRDLENLGCILQLLIKEKFVFENEEELDDQSGGKEEKLGLNLAKKLMGSPGCVSIGEALSHEYLANIGKASLHTKKEKK